VSTEPLRPPPGLYLSQVVKMSSHVRSRRDTRRTCDESRKATHRQPHALQRQAYPPSARGHPLRQFGVRVAPHWSQLRPSILHTRFNGRRSLGWGAFLPDDIVSPPLERELGEEERNDCGGLDDVTHRKPSPQSGRQGGVRGAAHVLQLNAARR
jgi:hypothetical protein